VVGRPRRSADAVNTALGPRDRLISGWWSRFLELLRADALAELRAIDFLNRHLSPAQLSQFERDGCFDVIGGTTGTRYRIWRGHQMNVDQLNAKGRRVRVLCFMPEGRLPIGDIMLAQKLALELFETDAIDAANKLAGSYDRLAAFVSRLGQSRPAPTSCA
jgi:hypothetical protein